MVDGVIEEVSVCLCVCVSGKVIVAECVSLGVFF